MASGTLSQLPQHSLIRFSGEDAQNFLHNQLSCDVGVAVAGRSTYGAYCNPKGRVLASFLLWRAGQDYFMQLPSSLREPIQQQLSKFIMRSKVKATDASAEYEVLGIAGKDAVALTQRSVGQVPNAVHDVAHAPGSSVIKVPGDRYLVVAAKDKAPQLLMALAAETEKMTSEYWEWLDIRAGVPTILPATQEAFVPQMLNLDLLGGVSFDKGCYPGQEIVARMHYRGTLKQRMYLANLAPGERPLPQDKLYSTDFGEQACGTIVNAAHSPQGGYDMLAVIQIAAAKGAVRWKSPQGLPLEVLALPYEVDTEQ